MSQKVVMTRVLSNDGAKQDEGWNLKQADL